MPMPEVHFAVGMGAAALLGLPLAAARRRWLVWLPLAMSLCGGLALAPDALARAGHLTPGLEGLAAPHRAHPPWANAFFLHGWLDTQPALYTRTASRVAFQAVALLYLAAACGYAAYIRWGIPRRPEAEEALARMRRAAAGYRLLAPLAGLAPLLLAGAATAWLVVSIRPARGPAAGAEPSEARLWAQLVARRMGLAAGQRLGVVHPTWDRAGQWLSGDLGARSPAIAEVVARAKANGCGFVTVLAEALPAEALAEARQKNPDLAILAGRAWNAPSARGPVPALVIVPPQPDEGAVLAAFTAQFGSGSGAASEAALHWLKARGSAGGVAPVVFACPAEAGASAWPTLFSWRRTNELFAGFLGLFGGERLSAREAKSQWDPRVATVGGVWDRFLDGGFRLWGAAAASGFEDPARQFGPGEFARTHVWSRGRAAADVLDALRRGCLWADEGGIVRELDFAVSAPALERPARMGEVARVAPGDLARVELALDVPPTDFAGRPNALDEVELVSNFGGEPAVVASVRGIRGVRRIEHLLPPAEDRNGGLGFYVRARGWRRLADGSRLCFYTNPVHVLVRAGLAPPRLPGEAPVRVASPARPDEPEPARPTPATPAVPAKGDADADLERIGLPRGVHAIHAETFKQPPSRQWRGIPVSIIGDRGPALGDEDLRVEFLHRVPLGEATRLFFRCYATACSRLTLVARRADSPIPCQAVRELPEKQWVQFDLSFADDFLPVRGASGGLRPPVEVQALEWAGARQGPLSRFYITDVVVYDPTPSSRQAIAGGEAQALLEALRETVGRRGVPPSARPRVHDAETRLEAWRKRLAAGAAPLAAGELEAAERDLAALAEECRRVAWQAAAARTLGVADPRFVVTALPPTQRVSARNPALRLGPSLAGSWEFAAAGGEAEGVQIAVAALWDRLEAVRVEASPLVPEEGGGLGVPVSVEVVDEVEVGPRPDLTPEQSGWQPDPLRPFEPFGLEPGGLRCVLLTVEVPRDLSPGYYSGQAIIRPQGVEPLQVALRLRVWGVALEGRPLAVLAPLDTRAICERYGFGRTVPPASRRAFYGFLLRHGLCPIPLLGGDEAADLDEVGFLLDASPFEELVVLHEATSVSPAARDAGVDRAARLASRLLEQGRGRRGALLLPLASRDERELARLVSFARALAAEHPALLLAAGGDGEPPGDLVTHVWRRPLGADPPRRPHDDDVEVRLSRTARREAWELAAASPESALPGLLLSSPLAHARLLPWLAWQHGVRALVLRGVARWQGDDAAAAGAGAALGDGILVYPPAPAAARADAAPPRGSLRLVALRDGIEDYTCLRLLWDRARRLRERNAQGHAAALAAAERLLAEVPASVGTFVSPCRDAATLSALRVRVARELERIEAAWWAEVDAAGDLPSPPARLTAEPGGGQIALAWPPSPDPKVTAYHVFRGRDPKGEFVRLTARPLEGLRYTDRAVADEVPYHYFVRACRGEAVVGPRSALATAAARPAPRIVWLPTAPPGQGAGGPYRVAVRLEGPGTDGLLPLVRPQLDYAVGAAEPDGFEDMTRQEDGSWIYDVPDPGWPRLAGGKLRVLVRVTDRGNQVVAPPVERVELIRGAPAP